ncbi:ABATE domain-containing protein [Cellulomonas sp. URHE0023]|uniref:CGNR zinc finger domain-containing protein n=1 Tax=Cellulomonas sp. URHE0023 TaxID=1380354 RepID=UPI000489E9F3|nr:CGNR zinc finger domain-containing protein [Cellulomonas sp. URHE0023]
MVAKAEAHHTPHEFRPRDFVGGHPAIDFVNTVTARNTATPDDWLDSYATLLRWASLSDLALPAVGAEVGQGDAEAELRRCRTLREALHATLASVQDDGPVPPKAALTLETSWRLAAAHARLDLSTTPFRLRYDQDGPPLSVARRALAAAAVELLVDLPRERLRTCPGERCGWMFLDVSKAGRRRWCDMATCGTGAKNRRRARP